MCIGHKSKIFGRDSQCRCDLPTVSVFGNLEKDGETRARLQRKHEMPCASPLFSSNRSDEGLTIEMSAFKLFTVATLRFLLS